ncbi:MAG TPA: family 43 glycosylhydrolase, partial [Balneolaceae bacterium]|nr:family 43 glycosylhydrolase [Balneolaceae bacterium]
MRSIQFSPIKIVFLFSIFLLLNANPAKAQTADIWVHDPVMIKQDSTYYIFCTGRGITVYSSTDMKHWKQRKRVFDSPPDWIHDVVPNFRNSYWAPDISFHNGKYYLYYAVSNFGKNKSAIGV